jgi:hypothetical protein
LTTRALAVTILAAALAAAAAGAQSLDRTEFRYVRTLAAPAGLVSFEPDGVLFAHARLELADLRILDAEGRQVPWRRAPAEPPPPPREVHVLNRGTRSGRAVALLDLGRAPGVHDRLELDIPEEGFVGRVQVSGSDDRRAFTRLSTTVVYDIAGARRARSTTVVYPPSDFRYLQLMASGIEAVAGAAVTAPAARPELEERPLRSVVVAQEETRTVVTADFDFRRIPVDELRVSAATPLYDRPVLIEGSNDGARWTALARARIFRFPDSLETSIAIAGRHKFLRVTIENADDAPLESIRLTALARPRTILVSAGYAPPYRVFYGNPALRAPRYDFAEAPAASLELEGAEPAARGAELLNDLYEPPEDERSFVARHPRALQATLAVTAVVLLVGAFLALRRRA